MTAARRQVLLISAGPVVPGALDRGVAQLVEAGCEVDLVMFRGQRAVVRDLPLGYVRMIRPWYRREGVRRFGPRWWLGFLRSLEVRGRSKVSDTQARVWISARRDVWMRRRAATADVLVALDAGAVWTVWKLARTLPDAAALHGLQAAVDLVLTGTAEPAAAEQRQA